MQIECVGCGATADGYIDGECAGCAEITARNALAAARDDVLRAALKDCETHPGDERLCNEDDVCLCDLCAAVDRWQKLEGSR